MFGGFYLWQRWVTGIQVKQGKHRKVSFVFMIPQRWIAELTLSELSTAVILSHLVLCAAWNTAAHNYFKTFHSDLPTTKISTYKTCLLHSEWVLHCKWLRNLTWDKVLCDRQKPTIKKHIAELCLQLVGPEATSSQEYLKRDLIKTWHTRIKIKTWHTRM